MKNVRVKVRESCNGDWFDIALCDGKKLLMINLADKWFYKAAAIKHAKTFAKRIGIKYSDEIHKMHGC